MKECEMLVRALPYLLNAQEQAVTPLTKEPINRLVNEVTGHLKMLGLYPKVSNSNEELYRAVAFMSSGFMGGFAACLADAWAVADSINKERLESTFFQVFQRARLCVAAEELSK